MSVRNLSPAGAKLSMDGLGVVHAGTVLLIPRTGEAHEVEVVWRDLPQLGVRFVRRVALEARTDLRRLAQAAA